MDAVEDPTAADETPRTSFTKHLNILRGRTQTVQDGEQALYWALKTLSDRIDSVDDKVSYHRIVAKNASHANARHLRPLVQQVKDRISHEPFVVSGNVHTGMKSIPAEAAAAVPDPKAGPMNEDLEEKGSAVPSNVENGDALKDLVTMMSARIDLLESKLCKAESAESKLAENLEQLKSLENRCGSIESTFFSRQSEIDNQVIMNVRTGQRS